MASQPGAAPILVGRDGELSELVAGLDDAASGSGRLFLLAGDPGIGKSRLAHEAAERARDRGFQVQWGRCWEAGGAPVYWPWVQALRACIRGLGGEELRSCLGAGAPFVAQIVAEVAETLPDVGLPPPLAVEAGRFRLFDAVSALLRNAAARQPLMLVLDDLHAADAPSVLLLRFVARELGDAHLLVLGAYRDIEVDRGHPLAAALADLSRESAVRHLRLPGLTEAGVGRLIQQTAGVRAGDSVVAAVHRYTEGNPLFVGEVVRLLAAEGRLGRIDDPAGLRLAIPEGIREVIGRRVARLPEDCGKIAGLASVFGREFSLPLLERLSGVPAGQLLDILHESITARVVVEIPGTPGRLRFTHALIRDVVYERIPAGQRLRLHQRAGEVLEAVYRQDLDPHLAELAYHFFEASPGGDAGKAISYARRAGERAIALLAYEEAARLFRMALAALGPGQSPEEDRARCRLLLALGDALTRMGERPAAKDELRRAAGIARRYGMAEELGRAALAYTGRFTFERAASDPDMITLLEDARAMLAEREGAEPVHARVLARLAAALRDQPDRGPRDALSRQAVALAQRFNDPPTLAYTLACRGAALYGPDDPAERLAIAEELRTVARAAQDRELEQEGEVDRALVFLETGRIAEYRAALDALQRLAAALRAPSARWLAVGCQAALALMEGRFPDAEALIESALRAGASAEPWDAIIYSRVQLFALRSEDGRLAELEPTIRRSAEEFPTRPLFRCLLARLLAELGDEDGARSVFDALAAGRFAVIPVNNDMLLSLGRLAEVAWFLRDAARGAVLHDRLLPYRGLVVDAVESSLGAVDRYLGLAAMTAGDLSAAERYLRDAVILNSRIGAEPWAARTQADLAGLLSARDQPADREQAIELLEAALGTAMRLGMTAFAKRAGEALTRVGGDGHPARAPLSAAPAAEGATLWSMCRREGEYWSIAFAGEAFRLKDVKGLRYLAHLLRHPGREFHVLDLAAAGRQGSAGGPPMSPARQEDLPQARLSDIGPVLDEQAKKAYRARLRALEDDLAEATSWADPVRAARARQEMQFLTDELTAAVGLGGRGRKPGSPAERARVNITRAIRGALSRIREHSPALADHLDATIHTGTFCAYTPDPRAPITWHT
ncbi:MAG TPA: AAA family ATPase [Streptosporangiaceae bacterium]|nr:AAA family ATPase [Streptosporangiaceae bacterium]